MAAVRGRLCMLWDPLIHCSHRCALFWEEGYISLLFLVITMLPNKKCPRTWNRIKKEHMTKIAYKFGTPVLTVVPIKEQPKTQKTTKGQPKAWVLPLVF
jgi:hypothetical protein